MPSLFTLVHVRESGGEVAAPLPLSDAALVSAADAVWSRRDEGAPALAGIRTPADLLAAFLALVVGEQAAPQGEGADAVSAAALAALAREVRALHSSAVCRRRSQRAPPARTRGRHAASTASRAECLPLPLPRADARRRARRCSRPLAVRGTSRACK